MEGCELVGAAADGVPVGFADPPFPGGLLHLRLAVEQRQEPGRLGRVKAEGLGQRLMGDAAGILDLLDGDGLLVAVERARW